ncbi:MAG: glycosyltransferase [Thermoleophilaceae bacterium]
MTVPHVSCVVTAYNLERFIGAAVQSALDVDWPEERLEVIVVDDGSTDGTAAVLAGFGDRIRAIEQPNRGFNAAMSAGIGAARGDYIAILDGDDEWTRDKLQTQVRFLESRPAVGLVHGDMEVMGADGHTLHPSFFEHANVSPERGWVLGSLLRGNFVSGGASVVRASLRERFWPIPPEAAYPDWYIASRVAEVAEIDHVDVSVNRYRRHDANMGLGQSGDKQARTMRHDARYIRWMLGHIDTSGTPVHEVAAGYDALLGNALGVALHFGGRVEEVFDVSDDDRARSLAVAAQAAAAHLRGDLDSAARAWIRALALDPWNGLARVELATSLRAIPPQPRRARTGVVPGVRSLAVLAFADELIADPGLLAVYGRSVGGSDDVTLVIQAATTAAREAASALGRALEETGLAGADSADMVLHPCDDPASLAPGLGAVYTRRRLDQPLAALPRLATA